MKSQAYTQWQVVLFPPRRPHCAEPYSLLFSQPNRRNKSIRRNPGSRFSPSTSDSGASEAPKKL